MHDPELETNIVNAFAAYYNGLKQGIQLGILPVRDQIQLIDQMAICFKDYVAMQRAGIETKMSIEKAKNP